MADETVQPDNTDPAATVEATEQDGATLQRASRLLERGDYGQVIGLLEPMAARHPAATAIGAELRLLLATALIGQGRGEEASRWCRGLRGSPDPSLRSRARDLQQILEAPALERPRDWSLDLPALGVGTSLDTMAAAGQRRRARRPEPPPAPPVGPTRTPYGFAALAGLLLALLLLGSLLGGCVEVRTDLRFAAPGRLQVSHQVRSVSGMAGPWQRRLAERLERQGYRSHSLGGTTRLEGPVLPAEQALRGLATTLAEGAGLADLPLPPPQFSFQERNWLVGVVQKLNLVIDLRDLPSLSGLALSIDLEPLAAAAVDKAGPLPVEPLSRHRLRWPLQPGQPNTLTVHSWRWNPLGLGAAAIGLVLLLVFFLQRLRRQLGFGLPELPG
jgi:hypothetical protein